MGQVIPRPDDTLERKLRDYERRLNAIVRSTVEVSTAFPTDPSDGQHVYYLVNSASGLIWHFRYRADSPSILKWEAVGRQEGLFHEVTALETTTFVGSPSAYTNLATVGPAVQVPLSGEYRVDFGALIGNTVAGAETNMSFFYDGVNDAKDVDAVKSGLGANEAASQSRRRDFKPLAAGAFVAARYRTTAGLGIYANRWLEVRPLRVAV